MFQFIVTNVLMVSLAAIFYLILGALPRIGEDENTKKMGILERWIQSGAPERIDAALNGFLFKFLRKLKVFSLRVDNFLTESLKKVKAENGGNGKTIAEIKEISEAVVRDGNLSNNNSGN